MCIRDRYPSYPHKRTDLPHANSFDPLRPEEHGITTDNGPVSYTHLDVYKRQDGYIDYCEQFERMTMPVRIYTTNAGKDLSDAESALLADLIDCHGRAVLLAPTFAALDLCLSLIPIYHQGRLGALRHVPL